VQTKVSKAGIDVDALAKLLQEEKAKLIRNDSIENAFRGKC